MASDDLNAPLGQDKRRAAAEAAGRRAANAGRRARPVRARGGGLGDLRQRSLGGEPIAVVATAPAAQGTAKTGARRRPAAFPPRRAVGRAAPTPRAAAKPAGTPPPPPGTKTVTIIDGSSGKQPGRGRSRAIERRAEGAGRPAAAGNDARTAPSRRSRRTARAPFDALRPPARAAGRTRSDAPRIAVIVGGLGISASGTADALAKLPAPVTLALRALWHRSRAAGRARARAKATKCCCRCRWSRSTIPTTIPARRRC